MSATGRLMVWRQGSTLPAELLDDARAGGVQFASLGPNDFACVITQTCDLRHKSFEEEPYFEALIVRRAGRRDGNYWHGKNPRTIQFETEVGGEPVAYEIKAREKIMLDRRLLTRFSPSDSPSLGLRVIRTIVHWVTKRYRRTAFPDAFNRRVVPAVNRVKSAIRRGNEFITGMFIRVDPMEELPEGSAYRVFLVGTMRLSETNSAEEEQHAVNSFGHIQAALSQCKGIELEEARLVPEQEFTLADMQEFPRWDYDYLSMEVEPEAPIAPEE